MIHTIRLCIVTYNSQTVFFILSLKSREFYTPLLYVLYIHHYGYLRLIFNHKCLLTKFVVRNQYQICLSKIFKTNV